jgi:hypothetical protein
MNKFQNQINIYNQICSWGSSYSWIVHSWSFHLDTNLRNQIIAKCYEKTRSYTIGLSRWDSSDLNAHLAFPQGMPMKIVIPVQLRRLRRIVCEIVEHSTK